MCAHTNTHPYNTALSLSLSLQHTLTHTYKTCKRTNTQARSYKGMRRQASNKHPNIRTYNISNKQTNIYTNNRSINASIHQSTTHCMHSMYVYIYIYIYISTHIYVYIYIYRILSVHIYMYIYIYMCIYIHTYTHIYLYIYIYPPIQALCGRDGRMSSRPWSSRRPGYNVILHMY